MSPRNATEIGQRRHYEWRGRKIPSVTTILKAWPMEWAIAYGAKSVAERAVFQHSELVERLNSDDPLDWTLRWLKSAPHQRRDSAAASGTNLHSYLEARLKGEPLGMPTTPAEQAVEAFLYAYRPDPLYIEPQVFSLTDDYAGSADLFATVYGRRLVIDLKTGIVDHKARLQLAAYRYADFIGEDDEVIGDIPQCDGAAILSIPRDDPQSWQFLEVEAGPREYARFLNFARAWRFYDDSREQPVGELILPQAEGDAA